MKEMCASIGKMHEFLLALKRAGFDTELIQEIINSKNNELAKKMFIAVMPHPVVHPSGNGVIYDFFVDYTRTVEEMVKAGNYNSVHGAICSDHFPIPPEKLYKREKIKTKLFHFQRQISIDLAAEKIEREGYRPASAHEALAFAEHNPDLQKQFSILAIGSPWLHGVLESYFIALTGRDSYRGLVLLSFDGGASEFCRFLAVSS